MKALVLFILLISSNTFGQVVGGTIVTEGRDLLTESDFRVEGTVNGFAIYELAVNSEGQVTSAKFIEGNIKSTPTKMAIRNYVMNFEFEGATYYPKFQHCRVKITTYRP